MGCDMMLYVEKCVDGKWQAVPNPQHTELAESYRATITDLQDKLGAWSTYDVAETINAGLLWFDDHDSCMTAFFIGVPNKEKLPVMPHCNLQDADLSQELRLFRRNVWCCQSLPVAVSLADVKLIDPNSIVGVTKKAPLREWLSTLFQELLSGVEAAVADTTPDNVRFIMVFD